MMKKFVILFTTLFFILGGVIPDGVSAPSSMPRIAKIAGNQIHSAAAGPQLTVYVTGNVSGNTQFGSSYFAGFGWSDDFFNTGWKCYAQDATNVSTGTLVDVTDFESSTGTFTVADAGAAWAIGDRAQLLFGILGTSLEGANQLSYAGDITSVTGIATPRDSFYVEDFIGLPDDLFNEKFYVEYTLDATPATAPQSELVRVLDFVGSSGLVVTSIVSDNVPGFTSNAVLADRITVMHETIAWNRLPGRLEYSGVASLGGIDPTSAIDSIYAPSLKGFTDDYFNECNYWVHIINTTDGAAPLGEYIPILDYVSATGLFTFQISGAGFGLTADLDDYDVLGIVHESVVNSAKGDPYSGKQYVVSANTANTTTNFYVDGLVGVSDSALVGNHVKIVYTTDQAAPTGECKQITAFNGETGLLTVSSAFSAAPDGGDIIVIFLDETLNVADTLNVKIEYLEDMSEGLRDSLVNTNVALYGANGLPAMTGAKIVAAGGVSLTEGLIDQANVMAEIDSSLDNVGVAIFGGDGLPAATGAKIIAAGGVNINEGLIYNADRVADIDSSLANVQVALYGGDGLPAVTAAKFLAAGGVNAAEGFLFNQNSGDTLAARIYGDAGVPVIPTGLFPVNGASMLEMQVWQSDSLRRAFVQITTLEDLTPKTVTCTTPDGSTTTWTQAAHNMFGITGGAVKIISVVAYCNESLVGAGTIEFGEATAGTDLLLDQVADATTFDINEIWCGSAADVTGIGGASGYSDSFMFGTSTLELVVGTADITNGSFQIIIEYLPMTATASIDSVVWD